MMSSKVFRLCSLNILSFCKLSKSINDTVLKISEGQCWVEKSTDVSLPNTMWHLRILTHPIKKFSVCKRRNHYPSFKRTVYPGDFGNQMLATKRLPSQWTFLNRQGTNKG